MMRRTIALLCALALVTPPVYAGPSEDLPDIGSPSDTVLSRDQEMQIGRAIYKSLHDTSRVMSDPEIQEYIQDIGQKLSAHAQESGYRFHFFVVDDPTINAFALPGGFVGVHSGLLLATNSESELAGVLGHEISHVTQRHISRAIFANQRASILTMAALLGAILLGVATGAGGQAIEGAVMAAQGIQLQQQINFTRSNESEADRTGIGLMAAAGFNPDGMASFFETLGRQTGPLASQAPEFLRTHPVTVNRVAEARERAAQLPHAEVANTTGYGLARARIMVLTSPTPEAALERLKAERENPVHGGDSAFDYATALALMQLGRHREAADKLEVLSKANPAVIPYQTALASADLSLGRTDAAFDIYRHAIRLFPRNVPLTVHYAEALMQNGQAKEAHRILLDLLNVVPGEPEQVRLIALAASAAGDTGDAHSYMAEFHVMNGDLSLAADELRLALGIPGLDAVQRARFSSRLSEIQEVVARQMAERRPGQQQRTGGRQ